jgi:hypothetical protein
MHHDLLLHISSEPVYVKLLANLSEINKVKSCQWVQIGIIDA